MLHTNRSSSVCHHAGIKEFQSTAFRFHFKLLLWKEATAAKSLLTSTESCFKPFYGGWNVFLLWKLFCIRTRGLRITHGEVLTNDASTSLKSGKNMKTASCNKKFCHLNCECSTHRSISLRAALKNYSSRYVKIFSRLWCYFWYLNRKL